jgi:ribosomal protein L19
VKPVDLDSKADENEGAPWEGRVVAIKNEVSSVKSTVSRVTDGISHLERKLDMHSSMIT